MLTDFPEAAADYATDLNDELISAVTAGSDHIVSWRCPTCKGVYRTSPYHKTKEGTGCPYCSNKAVLAGLNDLTTVKPNYLRYWDYELNSKNSITPETVMHCANKKVYWHCEKGHSFEKSVVRMTSTLKVVCPICKKEEATKRAELLKQKEKDKAERMRLKKEKDKIVSKKRIEIENKKNKTRKELLKRFNSVKIFYDFDENMKYGITRDTIRYSDTIWLKCKFGHRWCQRVQEITGEINCPICDNIENSIAKKFPEVAPFYDEEKNGVPVNEKKAVGVEYLWWRCKKNHSFIADLDSVLQHKETGCMYCDKEKSYYSPLGWTGMHM